MTEHKETFVFDGIEVYKTGRVAEQQTTAAKRKILAKRGDHPPQMIEVKPVDSDLSPFKAKWVKEETLYRVLPEPSDSGEIILEER